MIEAPFPNPFVTSATIPLRVKKTQSVTVDLYDVLGRHVQRMFSGSLDANSPKLIRVDGQDLPAGTYVYRVKGEDFAASGIVRRL